MLGRKVFVHLLMRPCLFLTVLLTCSVPLGDAQPTVLSLQTFDCKTHEIEQPVIPVSVVV